MIRRLTLLLALAAAALHARAQQPVDIRSDGPGVFDDKTGETVFTDNVRLTDGSLLLTADELRYNQRTGTASTRGHVVVTRGAVRLLGDKLLGVRLLADKVIYHSDGTFTAEHVRLGTFPYYIEGESAAGTLTELTVNHATVTYGEPGPWQPTMTADRIVYVPGQRLRSENVHLGIGHAQFLPLPKFQQDLHESLLSLASFSGGYRRSLGGFVETGLHLPAAAGVRLGADLGFYTARGVMFGPSGGYARGPDGADLHGYFRSGFINDHGDKKTDLLGQPVPENRGYVEWEHTQQLADNLTLVAQLNWWKDSEILRDFRPRAFFPVQEPDTFAESVYTGRNYFVSLFGRLQPNAFNRVQERLPEVRFDLLPLAVGGGFHERFSASAAVLREDPPLRGPSLRSTRLDAYYALTRPFAPAEWLAFIPVAGGRVTHYADTIGATTAGGYTRTLGELGFDAALRSSATFDYKNEQWNIDGLRHLLTPRLSYRYIPDAGKGRGRIPLIDRQVFTTYLQPLGLGDVRNLDDLHATNTLRLGFDNTVQTRDADYGSRDLFTFNVAGDFRFKRASGERDISEIQSELAFAPAHWLQVDVFNRVSPRSATLQELNSGITMHDGDTWSLRFSNNFLRREIEDYVVDGRVRINATYEALTRLHYDARRRRFNEQAYGLAQSLDSTWRVSYVVTLYSGPRRESHFGFNVQIEATGF